MLSVTAKDIGSSQTSDVSDYTSGTRMMSAVCMAHFNEIIIQISIADHCVGRLCPNFKAPKWCKQIPSMFFLDDVDAAAEELWIFPCFTQHLSCVSRVCVCVCSLFFYSGVPKQNSRDSLFIPTMSDALVSPVLMNKLRRKVGVCIFTL